MWAIKLVCDDRKTTWPKRILWRFRRTQVGKWHEKVRGNVVVREGVNKSLLHELKEKIEKGKGRAINYNGNNSQAFVDYFLNLSLPFLIKKKKNAAWHCVQTCGWGLYMLFLSFYEFFILMNITDLVDIILYSWFIFPPASKLPKKNSKASWEDDKRLKRGKGRLLKQWIKRQQTT